MGLGGGTGSRSVDPMGSIGVHALASFAHIVCTQGCMYVFLVCGVSG